MRISELARRSGVPVGTVKYYLREELLPAGEPTSATQAQYGEEHVARLGLIRALLGTGGLSISTARAVLAAVDDPELSAHDMIGAAHSALPTMVGNERPDLGSAHAHLRRWGWQVHHDSPAVSVLAQALQALQAAGFDTPNALLDRYARAAHELGEQDVAEVPMDSPVEAVRFVVIGTLLLEPVLLSLRRLAQEDVSARRLFRWPDA
ncbi:MAG: MerR family transcriptional regulator [Actinomycetota bacterium]|jgi:DNA-binding transcriptional MerR regulator|nr:MerR family transcriptional regulator [Actinomycetota bacterium]